MTVLVFNFYRDLALKDARQEAFYVLDAINGVRDYVSTIQRPLIEELKEEGAIDKDLFDPRLMSSSYITRQIYKIQLAKKNINYDYKLIATDPLNALAKIASDIIPNFLSTLENMLNVNLIKNLSESFLESSREIGRASCRERV